LIRALWIISCLGALGVSLVYADVESGRDIDVFLIWVMLILSFPLGFLVVITYGALSFFFYSQFGWEFSIVTSYDMYLYLTVLWLIFVLIGYFQWFYLVPYLYRRYRRKVK